jgi:hypothetical protein
MYRSVFQQTACDSPCTRSRCVPRAGLVLFVLLTTASCKVADQPVAVSSQDLATLFAKLQSGNNSTSDIQAVLPETRNAPRTDPNWPALTYLAGEAHLKR